MIKTPNILFVFPDQLGARWLGCYGNETVKTPVIDRFASHSTQFNCAYTNAPLCTPYRACLFTGQYASQTGVTTNGMRLPLGTPTLADHLNSAGYETRYVGKWHLSGQPHANRWVPTDQRGGFQHFIGWESHHVDHNAGLIWRDDPHKPEELRGHETDGLTDIVCDELEALASSRSPFFMTVAYQAPHPPCSPPSACMDQYDESVLTAAPNTDRQAWFKLPAWNADYGTQEFRRRYFGEISHFDSAFARVLDTLERTGLNKDTIVILTSDHGEMAGCHGLFGKNVMFEESVRVPLLVRVPDVAGGITDTPVSTIDLHPTLLDLAGVASPPTTQGTSLIPLIAGEGLEARDIFIEDSQDCIVRNNLKLVTRRDSDQIDQCFDLAKDPYELNNLAYALDLQTRQSLLSSLNTWRNRTRASTVRS